MTPHSLGQLTDARIRTLELLAPLADDVLRAQHSPLMSPLVWDLAHIAHYEELWLLRELGAGNATDPRFDDVYDAFRHPRAERPTLDILDPDGARSFCASVRNRVAAANVSAGADERVARFIDHDFVYGMVARHEHQHIETMLATLQLMAEGGPDAAGDGPGLVAPTTVAPDAVAIPAGPFVMGTDTDPWAYDNERPAHAVDLPAFRIDLTPTTNAEYAAFVEDGGYDDPGHWSDTGWKSRQEAELTGPQFWTATADGWHRRRFGRLEVLPPHEPVQHICWYEADAYARWAGKRLPT
ncbi:MAG: SUMF1/EgtB/PvdO family nonheme iron enzyme, partial [Acidimicrobiia bacterium]